MEASPPQNKGGGAADRLSDLPDELIHAVMSFLPAREAVQTSLLSKRWRGLCTTMPCLNLDQQEFDFRLLPGSLSFRSIVQQFYRFVNNLLLLNTAPLLDRFRLVFSLSPNFVHYEFIRLAVARCPVAIDIRYDGRDDLGQRFAIPRGLDYSRYFGRLRKLRLYKFVLDGHFAVTLESECPMLEDVELGSCYIQFSEIRLPVLKNLSLHNCNGNTDQRLVVTAPALVCLSCKDNVVLLYQTAANLFKSIGIHFTARINSTCGHHPAQDSSQPVQRYKPTCSWFRDGNATRAG